MRVAVVQVRPGVEDRDDRFAGVVLSAVAHLLQARAMAERTQIVGSDPAVAAQLLWSLRQSFGFGHAAAIIRFSSQTEMRPRRREDAKEDAKRRTMPLMFIFASVFAPSRLRGRI